MEDRLTKIKPGQAAADPQKIRLWARQLISALYEMHVHQCIAHRDIKPENFVLNESDELVLVDFGLAKSFKDNGDDTVKGICGTIRFYAPEVVQTGVKDKVIHAKKTDIWAAGVFLYRLFTGGYPFDGEGVM